MVRFVGMADARGPWIDFDAAEVDQIEKGILAVAHHVMHGLLDALGAQGNGVEVAGQLLGVDVFLIEMLALYTVREAVERFRSRSLR
jgi:hypothetical protein